MKKTVTYLGVKQVSYVFSENEILLALREHFKIKASDDYEFNLCEVYGNMRPFAELTIKYPKAVNKSSWAWCSGCALAYEDASSIPADQT